MKDFDYPSVTTYEREELDMDTVFTGGVPPSEPV